MTNLRDAKCAGLWWLFDSTLPADHAQAKAICFDCPAIAACRELLRETQLMGNAMRDAGGGPRGTWAGELVGRHERRPGRGTTYPREHGTDRGYHQHRRYREKVCGDCRDAHAAAERERVKVS